MAEPIQSRSSDPKDAARISQTDDIEAVKALNSAYQKMSDQLGRIIVGQKEVLEQILVAVFCRGHARLVDVRALF